MSRLAVAVALLAAATSVAAGNLESGLPVLRNGLPVSSGMLITYHDSYDDASFEIVTVNAPGVPHIVSLDAAQAHWNITMAPAAKFDVMITGTPESCGLSQSPLGDTLSPSLIRFNVAASSDSYAVTVTHSAYYSCDRPYKCSSLKSAAYGEFNYLTCQWPATADDSVLRTFAFYYTP